MSDEQPLSAAAKQPDRAQETGRSESLALIGTYAAGIMHELNNRIGAIILAARNAADFQERAEAPEIAAKCLASILRDSRRAAALAKSVLLFAKQRTSERTAADLNVLVQNAVTNSRELLERDEESCSLEPSPQPLSGLFNAAEIEQALENLIRNALESGEDARVAVTTVADEGKARLVIEDHGCGMTPADQQRAFEPFFTRKSNEGQLGLGLTVARSIIEAHGGSITIASQVGQGTRVEVALPLQEGLR